MIHRQVLQLLGTFFSPVISMRAYSQWTIDNLKYMYYSCVFGLDSLLRRVRLLMQIAAIRR